MTKMAEQNYKKYLFKKKVDKKNTLEFVKELSGVESASRTFLFTGEKRKTKRSASQK